MLIIILQEQTKIPHQMPTTEPSLWSTHYNSLQPFLFKPREKEDMEVGQEGSGVSIKTWLIKMLLQLPQSENQSAIH